MGKNNVTIFADKHSNWFSAVNVEENKVVFSNSGAADSVSTNRWVNYVKNNPEGGVSFKKLPPFPWELI
jgi:hypothetical protein